MGYPAKRNLTLMVDAGSVLGIEVYNLASSPPVLQVVYLVLLAESLGPFILYLRGLSRWQMVLVLLSPRLCLGLPRQAQSYCLFLSS